ncbi:MAG: FAD-dependent oxidoreductase [Syntrophaceae bacterium]|nr:FAD-dependent oxidoreductase [Syntrophaceae bacterium]
MVGRVIIIGAGLAGLTAALAARKEGAAVLIADRGPIGLGTNSALANGVMSGPSERYAAEDYIRDTLRAGCGLNCAARVRLTAREAPSAFRLLRSVGIPIRERGAQRTVVSPDPSVIPGVTLMRMLADHVRGLDGVRFLPGFCVTELLCRDGRACGIRGFTRRGEPLQIEAPAVILATGGAGAVWRRHDNQRRIMGQGYALAARAGLELLDMEFVQFYPLVLAEPGLPALIVYPPFAREARLIGASGEDILEKHGLADVNDAIVKKRDRFSALLFEEAQAGGVFLDLRGVPAAAWGVHPLAIFRRLRFPFRERPVAVAPAAHFMMGGVRAAETGETALAGLFACGEILWGLHGANRLGGNALTECVVSGALAGRFAAERALAAAPAPSWGRIAEPAARAGGAATAAPYREILASLRDAAWGGAGVVRSENSMRKALSLLDAIEDRLDRLAPQSVPQRLADFDLRAGALTLRAVLQAGLAREESRGSFLRSDRPAQDDGRWRRNSCLQYDVAGRRFTVGDLPVEED